ncbi:hypothetical protein BMS3Bbin04_02116 [bacterium BMS3Bbin04]|nr:hypothetical protein BMS3Bbin04_02116 [bacterium BMS3Bbin04]
MRLVRLITHTLSIRRHPKINAGCQLLITVQTLSPYPDTSMKIEPHFLLVKVKTNNVERLQAPDHEVGISPEHYMLCMSIFLTDIQIILIIIPKREADRLITT